MEHLLIGILGIAGAVFAIASGVHIAVALGVVGLFGGAAIIGFGPMFWLGVSVAYHLVASFTFIALPLFIFMGVLAGAGGISRDVYEGLKLWVGQVKGGLGITTVVSCAGFGVITGSSLVTAAVFAKVSAPEMRTQGYSKQMAYGICSSAGSIGMLIPPSILMVIYGLLSGQSIGKLLIAGISPGILLTVTFSLAILFMTLISPDSFGVTATTRPRVTWRRRITSLRLLWPIFVVGMIIIGGIFGGVFTPSEAAALGAFVVLIIVLSTSGSERWNILRKGLTETISTTAMVFLIIVGAGLFARLVMLSGITDWLLDFAMGSGLSESGFVIATVLIYLAMGCFLDIISMISITLPIILPLIGAMGIEPIWFAMVSVLAMEVGLITPPVGLNVYAAFAVAEPDVSLEDIFRGVLPFFFTMVLSLVILFAFPWLSTYLPNLLID